MMERLLVDCNDGVVAAEEERWLSVGVVIGRFWCVRGFELSLERDRLEKGLSDESAEEFAFAFAFACIEGGLARFLGFWPAVAPL